MQGWGHAEKVDHRALFDRPARRGVRLVAWRLSGQDDEGDDHYGAGAGGGSDAAPAVSYKESVLTYLLKVCPLLLDPVETHSAHFY